MSRYENYEIKNNVFGTLSAPISSLATTIQLGDGQGVRFSENMLATLENIENGKVMKREIVLITAINGDVLTVTRKYAPCPSNDEANTQGQVSYAFSADDTISAYIDKEHFDKIDSSINDLYDNGVNKLRTEVVSGLQIKVNPGTVLVGNSYYEFAGDTITLTNDATNYVEIDEDGDLVANTSAWGDKNTKIAKVTTSSGAVTSIEDWRLGTVGGKIGGIEIHELTEKDTPTANDELIISDSENIRQNKKVKYSSIGEGVFNIPCGEDITGGKAVTLSTYSQCETATQTYNFGTTSLQKIAIKIYGSGKSDDKIYLRLGYNGSATNDLILRIETNNNGKPSGTLVDVNATATISKSNLTAGGSLYEITLNDNITIPSGINWIVLEQSTADNTNYAIIGGDTCGLGHFLYKYSGGERAERLNLQTIRDEPYGGVNTSNGGTFVFDITPKNVFTGKAILRYFDTGRRMPASTITITDDEGEKTFSYGDEMNVILTPGNTYRATVNTPSGTVYYTTDTMNGSKATITPVTLGIPCQPNGMVVSFWSSEPTDNYNVVLYSNLTESYIAFLGQTSFNKLSKYIGIALKDGNDGEYITAITQGKVSQNNLSLVKGKKYYLASNGNLTLTKSSDFVYMGVASGKNEIKIDIKLFYDLVSTSGITSPFDCFMIRTGTNSSYYGLIDNVEKVNANNITTAIYPVILGQQVKVNGGTGQIAIIKGR